MSPTAFNARFKPWMLVSAIWIWPALFGVLENIGHRRLSGAPPASAQELLFSAGDWLIYAVVTPFIFAIARRWPIERPRIARRIAVHVGFALLFCVVWAVSGKIFELALTSIFQPSRVSAAISAGDPSLMQQVAKNVASWILTTLPFGAVVYTTVAGVAHALTYVAKVRERDLQVGKLAEQLSHARFAALQAQVNPHFLFNTLNTITVLVRDGDRSGAVRIVEQLSDVLRRTLSPDRANEVPLGNELELVRQYLAIEQARFSDRLNATISVESSLERAAVPSFAVQHLVENAIRHGIAKRLEAGRLTVTAARVGDSLVVTVTDDGLGLRGATTAVGHGIENTRERLRALYGTNASLQVMDVAGGGAIATLRVPFHELAPNGAPGTDAAR